MFGAFRGCRRPDARQTIAIAVKYPMRSAVIVISSITAPATLQRCCKNGRKLFPTSQQRSGEKWNYSRPCVAPRKATHHPRSRPQKGPLSWIAQTGHSNRQGEGERLKAIRLHKQRGPGRRFYSTGASGVTGLKAIEPGRQLRLCSQLTLCCEPLCCG